MSFNSTHLQDNWCSLTRFNFSKTSSTYNQAILSVCVATFLLAPMAVTGNAFILAAIWRNPSLRTPSYVLLAGLAFTDFCTGLLTQPFFALLMLAERLRASLKTLCISRFATESAALYFSSLTVVLITLTAVERWLHMSRRSLLTVRRIVVIYITFAILTILVVAGRIYSFVYPLEDLRVLFIPFLLSFAICVVVTAFAYFKVFRIIRHHQNQVQTNQNTINMEKYRKSIFTILYILAIFILSYVPYCCCSLVLIASRGLYDTASAEAALKVCAAVIFSSSLLNPLLYCWRIKEIRGSVRTILRKFLCKQNGAET